MYTNKHTNIKHTEVEQGRYTYAQFHLLKIALFIGHVKE